MKKIIYLFTHLSNHHPSRYVVDTDCPLTHAGKSILLQKPNLHQVPIFRRARATDKNNPGVKERRGPIIGLLQWTSDGEVSAFGDDGLFKGGDHKTHAGVISKYADLLAPILEAWLGEIWMHEDETAGQIDENGLPDGVSDGQGTPKQTSSATSSGKSTPRKLTAKNSDDAMKRQTMMGGGRLLGGGNTMLTPGQLNTATGLDGANKLDNANSRIARREKESERSSKEKKAAGREEGDDGEGHMVRGDAEMFLSEARQNRIEGKPLPDAPRGARIV